MKTLLPLRWGRCPEGTEGVTNEFVLVTPPPASPDPYRLGPNPGEGEGIAVFPSEDESGELFMNKTPQDGLDFALRLRASHLFWAWLGTGKG